MFLEDELHLLTL